VYAALAKTLRVLPKVQKPPRLPRMADIARFGMAVERVLHWPDGSFLEAYETNIRSGDRIVLEANPVVNALEHVIAGHAEWRGTARDLLRELDGEASELVKRGRDWPKDAARLGRILRRLQPNLERTGLVIEYPNDGRRTIVITRVRSP